jgi:hypothetical protein
VRGRHALYSSPVVARTRTRRRGFAAALPFGLGAITLDCSACGARSDVPLFEFAMLHMPLWLWRPGRGYTRLMTCPACRKRTWISASLTATAQDG